jgi:hypothetical protein
MDAGELKREDRDDMRFERNVIGGYKFVIMNSIFSFENDLSFWNNLLMQLFYQLKVIGTKEEVIYGLDSGNVIYELYASVYHPPNGITLQRISD